MVSLILSRRCSYLVLYCAPQVDCGGRGERHLRGGPHGRGDPDESMLDRLPSAEQAVAIERAGRPYAVVPFVLGFGDLTAAWPEVRGKLEPERAGELWLCRSGVELEVPTYRPPQTLPSIAAAGIFQYASRECRGTESLQGLSVVLDIAGAHAGPAAAWPHPRGLLGLPRRLHPRMWLPTVRVHTYSTSNIVPTAAGESSRTSAPDRKDGVDGQQDRRRRWSRRLCPGGTGSARGSQAHTRWVHARS